MGEIVPPPRAWTTALLSAPETHPTWESVIIWWELRRFPYNVIVGAAGVFSMMATLLLIFAAGEIEYAFPEPMAWIAMPLLGGILFNFCYTAGWVAELLIRVLLPKGRNVGPTLLFVGILLSFAVVAIPAVAWAIHDTAKLLEWLAS